MGRLLCFSQRQIDMKQTALFTKLIFLLLCLGFANAGLGQAMAKENSEAAKAFEKEYKKNIKLSKINDVYIPKTLGEAHRRLEKLSPPNSIAKFKMGEEKMVAEKLHFGIGRWMIVNWNFYGGSRISHLVKEKGVLHPDDMAQFILRTFHRKLNDKPLDEETLIEELSSARKKTTQDILGFQTKENH